MEFLIGLFGLLYIAYRLADEKWTASIIKNNEQANLKADEQRKQRWLSIVVDEEKERELSDRLGKLYYAQSYNRCYSQFNINKDLIQGYLIPEDDELVAEINEIENRYGKIPQGYHDDYILDALLANRGLIRKKFATTGIHISAPREQIIETKKFFLTLNTVLKEHGVNDDLYCYIDYFHPFEKLENMADNGGGTYIRWGSSWACHERYSSDLTREMRHDTTGYFNDYLKPF